MRRKMMIMAGDAAGAQHAGCYASTYMESSSNFNGSRPVLLG
jgi:hypothetical protein